MTTSGRTKALQDIVATTCHCSGWPLTRRLMVAINQYAQIPLFWVNKEFAIVCLGLAFERAYGGDWMRRPLAYRRG